ncbi:MAG: ribonuclease E/G, partial [Actinomycetota bacterium]
MLARLALELLEAARAVAHPELAHHHGGNKVIDFVDMESKTNRDAVIDALKEELAKDRSKVYLVSISPLGLVEMTRQNVTDGVREIMTSECPCCAGEGRVLSDETLALDNLRMLRRWAHTTDSEAFLVEANSAVAARMLGPGGRRLEELERETGKHFSIVARDDVPRERCESLKHGTVKEILEDAIPVEAGQELEVDALADEARRLVHVALRVRHADHLLLGDGRGGEQDGVGLEPADALDLDGVALAEVRARARHDEAVATVEQGDRVGGLVHVRLGEAKPKRRRSRGGKGRRKKAADGAEVGADRDTGDDGDEDGGPCPRASGGAWAWPRR